MDFQAGARLALHALPSFSLQAKYHGENYREML
jgi:hypothetical protein